MKKNIDITIFLSSFVGGGAERVLLQLCDHFCDRGLTIDLIVVNDRGPLETLVPRRARFIKFDCVKPSKAIIKLTNYLIKTKPRAILSALTHANIACAIAHQLSMTSCKLVLSERINIKKDLLDRCSPIDRFITEKLIQILYKRADAIVAVSKGVEESIKILSNSKLKNTTSIYNPIDTKKIIILSRERITLPWEDSLPIIISSGRITFQKNFQCLLKAFSIMRKRIPSHLIILGKGEQHQEIVHTTETLKIKNDVWLPGYCHNPYPYMAQSKLYVLPSRFEGLPNVLLEALALGIPIISTNCPSGPEEILAHGKYGRLVPVDDPVSMAEAMEKSLSGNHPEFDQAEALHRFQPELIVDQYLYALGVPLLKRNTSSHIF